MSASSCHLPCFVLLKNIVTGIGLAAMGVASATAQSDAPVIGKYYSDSKPGTAPTPPNAKGAPNILWILIDDVGFGASSAYGGAGTHAHDRETG
jgi:arylsulfatase